MIGSIWKILGIVAAGWAGGVNLTAYGDFYVWQRNWSAAVVAAAQSVSAQDHLLILAGELRLDGWHRVAIPDLWRQKSTSVLRITVARRNDFTAIAEEIARMPAGSVQLDCDVPEAGLEDYAQLLRHLTRRFPEHRISITLLPCHLKQTTAMRHIVNSGIDYFVLQLHGAEYRADGEFSLMEAAGARTAIAAARRLNFPFRIALPTYAYVEDHGRLRAEGFPAAALTETMRVVAPDGALITALIRENPDLPVIWFRLPVRGERWNLDLATIRQWEQGKNPAPECQISIEEKENYATISLEIRHQIPGWTAVSPDLSHLRTSGVMIPLGNSVIQNGIVRTPNGACGEKVACAIVILNPSDGSEI